MDTITENSTWNKLGETDVGQTIIINVTERCNLDCVYCYEHGSRDRDIELRKVIPVLDNLLASYNSLENISINFTGGEPLLGFSDIQRIYQHIQKNYIQNKKWKSSIYFSMTTNGTLLPPDMARWFDEHPPFVFALSFDGTLEAQNRNRSNSYDKVMENLWFFRKNPRPMKMTVGPDSITQCAQGVKYIHALGFECTCNIVFEDVWGEGDERREYLRIFAGQLSELVDYYAAEPGLPRSTLIRPLVWPLPRDNKKGKERYCGGGSRMILIDVDGKVYPCHRYAPLSCRRSYQTVDFSEINMKPEACRNCELLTMCPTCHGYNYEMYGDPDHKTTFHCHFFMLSARASAELTFRDVARIKQETDLKNLKEDDRAVLGRRLQSALFVEEYTRPLIQSLFS